MGGHPVAEWHSLDLQELVQVWGPSAMIWVASRGPLPLPMSPGGPTGRTESDS